MEHAYFWPLLTVLSGVLSTSPPILFTVPVRVDIKDAVDSQPRSRPLPPVLIREGISPLQLATSYCKEHGLDPARYMQPLATVVRNKLDAYRASRRSKNGARVSERRNFDGATVGSQREEEEAIRQAYDRPSLQASMLADAPRMTAYAAAIRQHAAAFRNATVLDVGCGSGVLAVLALVASAFLFHSVLLCAGAGYVFVLGTQ